MIDHKVRSFKLHRANLCRYDLNALEMNQLLKSAELRSKHRPLYHSITQAKLATKVLNPEHLKVPSGAHGIGGSPVKITGKMYRTAATTGTEATSGLHRLMYVKMRHACGED